jgi:quercetin dioxygenase-like cupin family protein
MLEIREVGRTHQAPVAGGPSVEILVGPETPERPLELIRVQLPPGGGMPTHDHGPSAVLVTVQSGGVRIESDTQAATLEPGMSTLVERGERVAVTNTSADEPATLLAVIVPPGFAETVSAWPSGS